MLVLLSLATDAWAAGGTVTDTTIFNLQAPWTTPARDYVSRTYGVATFLSGPQGDTDGIRWVHHFSLPSSPIVGASLYITLEDDGDSGGEEGALSCEGYWIDVNSYHPPGGVAPPIPLACRDYGPLPSAGCWFEVDNGTYEFEFTPGMVNWLNAGKLDCVFRAGSGGDFYIKSSVLEIRHIPPSPEAWDDYIDDIQKIYIGYYQRPADPAGLVYWAKGLHATGGSLTDIIAAFANSAESQALYGTIDRNNISAVVDALYNTLFGRDAEVAGLDYYVDGFNSGHFTAATIMLDVLNGARNEDLQSVNNKLEAARQFTMTIDPELDGLHFQATYVGNSDAVAARSFLSTHATLARVPIQAETTAFILGRIADTGDPILY